MKSKYPANPASIHADATSKLTAEEVMASVDVPDFARDFVAAVLACSRAHERRRAEGVTTGAPAG